MSSTKIVASNGMECVLETVAFINAAGRHSVRIEQTYPTGDVKVLGSFPTQAKADAYIEGRAAKIPQGMVVARENACHYCGLDRRTCDCH